MSPRLRRFIRWGFIIVFLLITPAIILSTAGYRYNFAKRRLERTGVLIVDSTPSGAAVFLNGADTGEKTPARLTRLVSGTYELRVEKVGYRAWTKDFDVASGATTFANDIVLFRQELPELQREVDASAAAFSPDGRYAAALTAVKPSWSELRVVDLKTGTVHLPFRSENVSAPTYAFAWSKDGRRLIIRRQAKGSLSFMLWDEARPDELADVRDLSPTVPNQAFWSEDGGTLYAADGAHLYAIDPLTRSVKDAGPSADGLWASNGVIYGFRDGKDGVSFLKRAPDAAAFSVVTTLPPGTWRIVGGAGPGLAAIDDAAGRLEVVDPGKAPEEALLFEGRAVDGAWSEDGSRLLYRNDFELHVYDMKARTDDVITRLGSKLVSATWEGDDDLVLFATETSVSAVEASHEGDRRITPLASFSGLSAFAWIPKQGTAWFAGSIGRQSGLWSLPLR